LGNSMASGSASDPMSLNVSNSGIRPYTSAGESFFKRGVALSFGKKRLSADAFFSLRKLDANINELDTISGETGFSSFQYSGLHRTDTEIADKNAINELFIGGNVRYRKRNIRFGVTG